MEVKIPYGLITNPGIIPSHVLCWFRGLNIEFAQRPSQQNVPQEMLEMPNATHFTKLENMMHSAPMMKLTGARACIKKGKAEITLPVRRKFFHAAGALHGSLYFLALDNAAFFAVNSLVEDVFVLTASLTTYLTRPVTEGTLKAVGKVVSRGRTQFIAESVLYDAEGREVGRANGIFVKSRTSLSEEIGYR